MACRAFGNDWTVNKKTDRSLVCTKGSVSWHSNCSNCSTWRLMVWEDGGSEYNKGEYSAEHHESSTVAGKYYGGHSPCAVYDDVDDFPVCGDWMTGGN